jgi:hypothetical protein
VKTRTLLLLAVGCGVAILAAGVVFLLGLANEDSPDFRSVGETVDVGDLHVTVTGYAENDGAAIVSLRLGGVDDDDGSAEFALVVSGELLQAEAGAADACAATTVADGQCTLTFPLGDAPGGSRVLRYQRGEERAVWKLEAGTASTTTPVG